MEVLFFLFFFSSGDLQQHLQTMFTLLRPEDNIRLVGSCPLPFLLAKKRRPDCVNKIKLSILVFQAVRLENAYPQCTRYMVVVSNNGRQDTEESVVLGVDFTNSDWSVLVTQSLVHHYFSHECSGLCYKLVFLCVAAVSAQLVSSYLCGVTL